MYHAAEQAPPIPHSGHLRITDVCVEGGELRHFLPLDDMWGGSDASVRPVIHGQLVDERGHGTRRISMACDVLEFKFDFGFTSQRPPGVWLTIDGQDYLVVAALPSYVGMYRQWQRKDALLMRVGRLLYTQPQLGLTGVVQQLQVTPSELLEVASIMNRVLPDLADLQSLKSSLQTFSNPEVEALAAVAIFRGTVGFRHGQSRMIGFAGGRLPLCLQAGWHDTPHSGMTLPSELIVKQRTALENVPHGGLIIYFRPDPGHLPAPAVESLVAYLATNNKAGVVDTTDRRYRLFLLPGASPLGEAMQRGEVGRTPNDGSNERPLLVGVLQMHGDEPPTGGGGANRGSEVGGSGASGLAGEAARSGTNPAPPPHAPPYAPPHAPRHAPPHAPPTAPPTLRPPPRLIHRPMRRRMLRPTPRPMVVWTITVGVATAAATTAARIEARIEAIAGVLTVAIAVAKEAGHAAVRQTGPKSMTDQGPRCVIVYWTGRWTGLRSPAIAAHRRTGIRWARGPIFDRAIHGQSTICATTNGRAV